MAFNKRLCKIDGDKTQLTTNILTFPIACCWTFIIKSGIVFLVGFIFEVIDLRRESSGTLCCIFSFLARYFFIGTPYVSFEVAMARDSFFCQEKAWLIPQ